jgi:carbonic anhydrase
MQRSIEVLSENVRAIVDFIRPSVEGLLTTQTAGTPDSLLRDAVRANICAAVGHLRRDSQVLKGFIDSAELQIVGAEYSLETGVVDFFDNVPRSGVRPPGLETSTGSSA